MYSITEALTHTATFKFMLASIQHGITKFTEVSHCGKEAASSPLVRIVHIRSILQSAMLVSGSNLSKKDMETFHRDTARKDNTIRTAAKAKRARPPPRMHTASHVKH